MLDEYFVIDQAFAQEVYAIDWFSRCGAPISIAVPLRFQPVATWKEAAELCVSRTWENTTLEARNELSGFLARRARVDFDERWNEITDEAKEKCVLPLTENVWKPFAKRHGFPIGFVSSVQWDVLAAIMEHEYRHVSERPTFFLHLLSLYRAGHLPCGWTDGEFPNGRLLVY